MTWLYIPSVASSSSLAPECLEKDSELGSAIWASRIAPSVTLSGKLMHLQFWLRAWKKAVWMRHLSGPTLPHSMQALGVAKWIASLPDSHAKTCQLLGVGRALTESAAAYSSKSSESQPIAVRGLCFWRTSQASLLPPHPLWTRKKANSTSARPPASWENWPTSGGMRSGSLFQRTTWAPTMLERGGSASRGAWPTPNTLPASNDLQLQCSGDGREKPNKLGWAVAEFEKSKWTTPSATDGERGGCLTENMSGTSLTQQVKSLWATPDCNTATYSNGLFGQNIREQASAWPTPNATDAEHPGRMNSGGGQIHLPDAANNWPTPASRDYKGANSEKHVTVTGGGRKHMDQLANFVAYSPHAKAGTDKADTHGMRAAQEQLGHKSASMTEHYVRGRLGKKVTPTR